MKQNLSALLLIVTFMVSCSKYPVDQPQPKGPNADLIKDWVGLHLRLIKNTTGVTHVAYSRHFAYTGVALYQALSRTPEAAKKHVYGPAAANAAIAEMLRYFYGAKPQNLVSIDSLEAKYVATYSEPAANGFDLERSTQFGKTIAANVVEWSKQDGAANASIPYSPLGEGYWEPTAPAYAAAAVPGWGNNRTILNGTTSGIVCPAPIQFSTTQSSPFYGMAKELYDVSKSLTLEQKAIALFWDDAPNGKYLTAFGHWFSIFKQVLENRSVSLSQAARAYLQLGITMNDAAIYCWKTKFAYSQLRPITYIRKYLGDTAWNSFITTPAHPEYLAAHATISSSAAAALEFIFGQQYAFTDHSYDNLGMQARSYPSFEAAAKEAGLSRLYGGIHYRPSIEAGNNMGRLVAFRVESLLAQPIVFPVASQN